MTTRLAPRSFTKLLTVLLCGVFIFSAAGWWVFSTHRINNVLDEQIALRAEVQSRQLAQLPSLVDAVRRESVADVAAIVSKLQVVTDADFITVSNEDGIRLAHPVSQRVGLHVVGGDIERALTQAESYLSHGVGSLGPSVRYISPILDAHGKVVGMIKVGYLKQTLAMLNKENISPLLGFAMGAVALSGVLAWHFSGYVSQQMQHLEPWQLRRALQTSQGVLDAAHEGLLAINALQQIYLINDAAKHLLAGNNDIAELTPIQDVVSEARVFKLDGEDYIDKMVRVNGRNLVVTRVTVPSRDKVSSGAVFSLRSQQEMQIISNKISQVNQHLETLRVTRHEYQNKLSSLAGLLQMGHYERALAVILAQSKASQKQMDSVRHLHSLPLISGLLLGKLCKASEAGVEVDIRDVEGWSELPEGVDEEQLGSLIGNLFNNSIEALDGLRHGLIRITMYETGREYILSVTNNGPAINVSLDVLCQLGYTCKPDFSEHGIGLHLVQSIVEGAGGHLELDSDENETSFTVYFPRNPKC